MADYVEDVTALGEAALEDVTETGGALTGSIRLEEPRLLALSIPYRDSWTVTVDGEPAETLKINGMYTGVLLEAGDHVVAAAYQIPGLKAGGMVSGVALVCTGGVLAAGAVRRRRSGGKPGKGKKQGSREK